MLFQNQLFLSELILIGEMLIAAATAITEVFTLRLDAAGRSLLQHALLPDLPGNGVRNKDHTSVNAGETVAAIYKLFNRCQRE